MEVERENQLNPTKPNKLSYVAECFNDDDIPVIATTDYMRAYAEQIRPYVSSKYVVLGTDGYGRSDSRKKLREFFEIDANSIVRTTAYTLFKDKKITKSTLEKIYKDMGVDKTKPNPWEV
jgi:pyruvate dehydrogenase E1 component